MRQLQQRTDRSIFVDLICDVMSKISWELTKMRMPSASFCQRSAILLSSSSAILRYILKRGAERSVNLGCSLSDITLAGPPGVNVGEIGDDKVEGQVTYLCGSLLEAYLQLHEEVVPLEI